MSKWIIIGPLKETASNEGGVGCLLIIGAVIQCQEKHKTPTADNNTKIQMASPVAAVTPLPGERFTETRVKQLSPADIGGMSPDTIRYAINEMFARHGADFQKADLKRYFQQFAWYHPRPGLSFDQIEADFSDVEKANVKFLGAVRDGKTPSEAACFQAGAGATDGRSTQEAEFRRFKGSGTLYKIPQLKDLVGRRLQNAWLYGCFQLDHWQGNTAYFYTSANFLGRGNTLVAVEFPETVRISQNAVNMMRDPESSSKPALQLLPDDPMELLRVTRENGQLKVFCRYGHPFSR